VITNLENIFFTV